MRLQELGHAIRQARQAGAITQAELARSAGVSRTTLNQLENGLTKDLGVRKILILLDRVGLSLWIQPGAKSRGRDFVKMACATAGVSFKTPLAEDELTRALLTGKIGPNRHAHLRTLLDEAPPSLLKGLFEQVSQWTRPGKLEKNLRKLAHDVQASRPIDRWLKTD